MRFVIDPARATVVEHRKLGSVPTEAPEIADDRMGRSYRYFYGPTLGEAPRVPDEGATFFYGAIGKVDVESGASSTWSAGADAVVSPPAFVARPGAQGEDDGWLRSYVLREASTSVVILDARDPAAGPLATIDLGVHLPGVSHTRWAGDVQLTG
jgi:carotenoid cleavage dioxygenase